MCALLHIFMCWRLTVRQAPPPRPGMTVDVFVPTYNESVDLVRKTLLAARAMDYPHETWLLDDGRRDAMRALAAQLGVHYLTRADNEHAKAGNLNDALTQTRGDFVAVFDADHAPRRDFLTKTLGYFDDEAVAFVQTPQDFYNLDSYQHRRGRGSAHTVWTEQSLFFRVIQRGKDAWNAAFFCGSCAVVRRSSLEAIGGFATGTVTEDLHTSIRLHAKGYRSIYHAEPLAFGLAPESIGPFIGQRIRWGQGAMHVWRKEGLLTHRGLTWAQRLNYLASVLTYFDGWQKGIFYLAPVVVLLTGTMPLIASSPDFLVHFVPYYLLTLWAFEEVGRGYGRTLFIEQYNMARFAAFAWATLAWVLPRRWLRFKVTRKGGLVDSSARFVAPQALVLALNVAAIPLGIAFFVWWGRLPLDGLIANALWALVNAALALAVLVFTSRTTAFVRSKYRFPVPLAAELEVPGGGALRGTIDDISESGFRFYGPLPANLEVGQAVCGRIALPDEPMPFRGEVRSVFAGEDGLLRAVGCHFETEARAPASAGDLPLRIGPAVGPEQPVRPHPHTDVPAVAGRGGRSAPQRARGRALERRGVERPARRARVTRDGAGLDAARRARLRRAAQLHGAAGRPQPAHRGLETAPGAGRGLPVVADDIGRGATRRPPLPAVPGDAAASALRFRCPVPNRRWRRNAATPTTPTRNCERTMMSLRQTGCLGAALLAALAATPAAADPIAYAQIDASPTDTGLVLVGTLAPVATGQPDALVTAFSRPLAHRRSAERGVGAPVGAGQAPTPDSRWGWGSARDTGAAATRRLPTANRRWPCGARSNGRARCPADAATRCCRPPPFGAPASRCCSTRSTARRSRWRSRTTASKATTSAAWACASLSRARAGRSAPVPRIAKATLGRTSESPTTAFDRVPGSASRFLLARRRS